MSITKMWTEEEIRKELDSPFIGVFLDGKNEYGYHVLPTNLSSIDLDEEDLYEDAEWIFKDAEELEYREGDCIILNYEWNGDYWEYAEINEKLTRWFFGSADFQKTRFTNMEIQ